MHKNQLNNSLNGNIYLYFMLILFTRKQIFLFIVLIKRFDFYTIPYRTYAINVRQSFIQKWMLTIILEYMKQKFRLIP